MRLAVAQHVRDITLLHNKGGNCSCKCPEVVIDLLSTSQRSSVQVSEEAFDQDRRQSFHNYNVMRPYTLCSSPVEMHGHACVMRRDVNECKVHFRPGIKNAWC